MSITLTSLRPFRLVRPTLITLTLSLRASSTSTAPPAPPPTRTCPSCSSSLSLTTSPCPSCSTLLPLPPSLSHHSILGFSTPIPISTSLTTFDVPSELATLPAHGYTIDPRDVRGRMLQKQKELHPDKYTNQGEKIVALARELSGRVNGAYGTLADPLKRAEYILSVHDQATEESDSLTDPALLAEILEAREDLDSASTEDQVQVIRTANHERVQDIISSLTRAFSQNPPDLARAKTLAVQLKYWQGLEEAAKEWSP